MSVAGWVQSIFCSLVQFLLNVIQCQQAGIQNYMVTVAGRVQTLLYLLVHFCLNCFGAITFDNGILMYIYIYIYERPQEKNAVGRYIEMG